MTKSDDALFRSFDCHERACILDILKRSSAPDKAAEDLRRMLFGMRIRLEKDGLDYYSLSTRIAYHFHRDMVGIAARLSCD
jgi:hypothetical protein